MLPIDECEEWIWDILDSNKDSGFEYIADGDKEFLIFNTNDFHADTRALYKIRKITGMRLAQISSQKMLYSPLVLSIKNQPCLLILILTKFMTSIGEECGIKPSLPDTDFIILIS